MVQGSQGHLPTKYAKLSAAIVADMHNVVACGFAVIKDKLVKGVGFLIKTQKHGRKEQYIKQNKTDASCERCALSLYFGELASSTELSSLATPSLDRMSGSRTRDAVRTNADRAMPVTKYSDPPNSAKNGIVKVDTRIRL